MLDIGCWGFGFQRLCDAAGVHGLQHFGVDREPPREPPPPGYRFAEVDVETAGLPFPDASMDGIVASHVLEHLARPFALLDEAFRVLRIGGFLYVECPSDRSLWLPSMPFKHEESRSLSFWDDPTHVGRPHTPQSLHRLFRMYGAEVLETRYVVSKAARLRLPWLIAKAWLRRDAALLEDAVWRGIGFAVFGTARKAASTSRRYVLR